MADICAGAWVLAELGCSGEGGSVSALYTQYASQGRPMCAMKARTEDGTQLYSHACTLSSTNARLTWSADVVWGEPAEQRTHVRCAKHHHALRGYRSCVCTSRSRGCADCFFGCVSAVAR